MRGEMTLFPQVSRYTTGAPDQGYYYPVLDYTVAELYLDGGSITIEPGTAIAVANTYFPDTDFFTYIGFDMGAGSSLISHGTPNQPNIFTTENMVQENSDTNFPCWQDWYEMPVNIITFNPDYIPNGNLLISPTLDLRFSKLYLPADGYYTGFNYHIAAGYDERMQLDPQLSDDSSVYLTMQDCSVNGGRINLGLSYVDEYAFFANTVYAPGGVFLKNNSFESVNINLDPTWYEYCGVVNCDIQVQAYNNLFRGGQWFHLEPVPATAGNWTFKDNLFDRVGFVQGTGEWYPVPQPLACDNNAYWPLSQSDLVWDINFYPFNYGIISFGFWVDNYSQLQPTIPGEGAQEVVLTTAPPYQSGPFGNFYLPDTTPLYGAGSASPGALGLYHYTTRIDQMKEGDDTSKVNANIGLHYIAANSAGLPLDTDGDGIPDYVEDANGNGAVDANETDWRYPATDGITPDASNSVYLDIDLSGDGLVGRVKTALGINPLDSNNPLVTKQIITGDEPDIVTFEVPINYNLLTNIGGLNLNINGIDATLEECDPATNGSCLMVWNTTYDPPGQNILQAQLMLNGPGPDTAILSAVGQIVPFNSTNVLQFFESGSMFNDNGAYLDAQLPAQYAGQNVTYAIDLYDTSTTPSTLIDTIAGSTSSGMIQENWGLTNAVGATFSGDSVDAVFNVTFPDLTSGKNTKTLNKAPDSLTEWGPNFDVLYMYMPTNNSLAFDFGDQDGDIWNGMLDVVDVLTMPAGDYSVYNSYFDNYYCYYCAPGQEPNPGYITSMSTVTNNLFPDMTNGVTKNLYCKAHGSGTSIGNYAGDVQIKSDVVANLLGNIYSPKKGLGGGLKTKNPYRFVFLDGCSTASTKNWRRAFGIFPLDAPNQAARNNVGPQAYVGWQKEHTGWMDGGTGNLDRDDDLATAYTQTLNNFYSDWMHKVPLAQCIANASVSTPNACPLPAVPPGNKAITISGTDVYGSPYSYNFTNVVTSKIFVVGHSGLRVDRLDSSQDNKYVAPVNTE